MKNSYKWCLNALYYICKRQSKALTRPGCTISWCPFKLYWICISFWKLSYRKRMQSIWSLGSQVWQCVGPWNPDTHSLLHGVVGVVSYLYDNSKGIWNMEEPEASLVSPQELQHQAIPDDKMITVEQPTPAGAQLSVSREKYSWWSKPRKNNTYEKNESKKGTLDHGDQ